MSVIPLHWQPGDRCSVDGKIAYVVGASKDRAHLVVRTPEGTCLLVRRAEAELPPLPPEAVS